MKNVLLKNSTHSKAFTFYTMALILPDKRKYFFCNIGVLFNTLANNSCLKAYDVTPTKQQ